MTFRPNATLTRAEAAALIDIDFGIGKEITDWLEIEEIRSGESFKIKIDDWYYSVSSKTGAVFSYGTCPQFFQVNLCRAKSERLQSIYG